VISLVNPRYLHLVNNRDVVGKTVRVALPEVAEQGYIEILDRVYAGEAYVGVDARYDVSAGNGQPSDERYLDFTYQPLRESDGSISGIIVLGVDVTDRKKTHNALIQAEKLAAVGRLASSIAHEINNPLESVTNLIYLAKSSNTSPIIDESLQIADRELAVLRRLRIRLFASTSRRQIRRKLRARSSLRAFFLCFRDESSIRIFRWRSASDRMQLFVVLRGRFAKC
jgi:nitrogen-specific signal transduction histidine kinase